MKEKKMKEEAEKRVKEEKERKKKEMMEKKKAKEEQKKINPKEMFLKETDKYSKFNEEVSKKVKYHFRKIYLR